MLQESLERAAIRIAGKEEDILPVLHAQEERVRVQQAVLAHLCGVAIAADELGGWGKDLHRQCGIEVQLRSMSQCAVFRPALLGEIAKAFVGQRLAAPFIAIVHILAHGPVLQQPLRTAVVIPMRMTDDDGRDLCVAACFEKRRDRVAPGIVVLARTLLRAARVHEHDLFPRHLDDSCQSMRGHVQPSHRERLGTGQCRHAPKGDEDVIHPR